MTARKVTRNGRAHFLSLELFFATMEDTSYEAQNRFIHLGASWAGQSLLG
jgi:hypothetical protein